MSFVQKAATKVTDAASSSVTGNPLTVSGSAKCLVVTASIFNTNASLAVSSVTDGTNTYTVRTSQYTQVSSHRQIEVVAYAVGVAAGTYTPTINLTSADASQTYAVVGNAEFSGVATSSPEDTWDANNDQAIDTNDVNAGPITTTDAGDLLIGCAGLAADSTTSLAWSSPTSWTNLDRQNDGYTSGTGHDSGYWLPGSIQTTYTPQWAHRNIATNHGSALVVALKPAAGGGAASSLILPSRRLPRALRHF